MEMVKLMFKKNDHFMHFLKKSWEQSAIFYALSISELYRLKLSVFTSSCSQRSHTLT